MSELLDERMTHTTQKQTDKQNNGRTGKQTLRLLLSDDDEIGDTKKPEPKHEQKIILYLRDDVNPADKNFTKNPNEMYDLMASHLTPYECVLYFWVWRMSWGYGKNYYKFSRRDVLNKTSLKSESSVRRAISGLRDKQFLILVLDDQEKPVLDKSGCLYRVSSPMEIISGKVEEGIAFEHIPLDGVFCITQLNMSRIKNNRVILNPVQIEPSHIEPTSGTLKNRFNMTPQELKTDEISEKALSAQIEPGHIEHPLKDRQKNIKDSLSIAEIVDLFYKGIGQENITKQKRERAEKNIEELAEDGFSQEGIIFAINWTIKNAKEKPYDFALIKDTIGQAMTSKKEIEAEEQKNLEREQNRAKQLAEEKKLEEEREKIKAYKESLPPEQRSELRENALSEIKKLGTIREELIGQPLIEAKENEILKKELSVNR